MDMDEHPELSLDELRSLLRRVELNQLETGDVPKLDAFLSRVIAQAEVEGLDEDILQLLVPDRQD